MTAHHNITHLKLLLDIITVCPSGSYLNPNNNGACELCPVNTYNAGTDSTSCNNCPSGTNTQGNTGQIAQSACSEFNNNI